MKLNIRLPGRKGPDATLTGGVMNGTSRLSGMMRTLRRNGPWILGGIILFTVFAWIALPTRAIAWRIGHEAKKAGYHVEVGDVSMSLFGGIALHDVRWTFEPSRPGQIPSTTVFEEVEVDVSVLKLVFGITDVDVSGAIDDGTFEANFTRGGDESTFTVEVSDLPLYAVPKARQALNAPLLGTVAMKIDLTMPGGKYAKTTGVIEVSCAACRVGDGETLLFVPGAKGLLAKGITVPEMDLGSLSGRIVFEDGVGTTDGAIEAESDDVHLTIDGTIDLKDPFSKSRFNLIMKLNIAEELQDRSDSIRLMVQTAPTSQKLEPPEQGLGFKLTGPLSRPRFQGINSKSREDRLRERREKARERAEKRAKQKRERAAKKKKQQEEKKTEEEEPEDETPEIELKPTIGEPVAVEPSSLSPSAVPPGDEAPDGSAEGEDQSDDGAGAAGAGGNGEADTDAQGEGEGEAEQPEGDGQGEASGGQQQPIIQ